MKYSDVLDPFFMVYILVCIVMLPVTFWYFNRMLLMQVFGFISICAVGYICYVIVRQPVVDGDELFVGEDE